MKQIVSNIATPIVMVAIVYYSFQVHDAIRQAGAAKRHTALFADLPPAPLKVVLQSTDGSTRVCPAQLHSFDLVNGESVLTVIDLACPQDQIFKDGFEK